MLSARAFPICELFGTFHVLRLLSVRYTSIDVARQRFIVAHKGFCASLAFPVRMVHGSRTGSNRFIVCVKHINSSKKPRNLILSFSTIARVMLHASASISRILLRYQRRFIIWHFNMRRRRKRKINQATSCSKPFSVLEWNAFKSFYRFKLFH